MKAAPLGGKIQADTLLYRIHRNSDQLQNEHNSFKSLLLPLNIQPANLTTLSVFPIWFFLLGCSGRNGWLGWEGCQTESVAALPPGLKVELLCQWHFRWKGVFLSMVEVGHFDTSASWFSAGSVLSFREGSGSGAAWLGPQGLIIQRKPLVFLTLGF